MLDALSVEAHGIDTVRATFRVLDAIPATDGEFKADMLGAGFRHQSQDWLDGGEVVRSDRFVFRDPTNSTLGFELRAGEWLTAEFSAPRLLDDSAVNLNLASEDQVRELFDYTGNYARELIPGRPELRLHKLNRLDYACDVVAGANLAGVVSAAAQFRFPGARKPSTHVYPGETATIRTNQRTFRCYGKGAELEHKLRPSQREQFERVLASVKEKGLTRMELMDRTRGGLAWESLSRGSSAFADRLETGLSGGVVTVGGLAELEARISALGLSSQRESTLLKFATRYAVLGEDGMKARYSRRTFHRHKSMFLGHGLRLDDVCTFSGELDFRPVIEHLRMAA